MTWDSRQAAQFPEVGRLRCRRYQRAPTCASWQARADRSGRFSTCSKRCAEPFLGSAFRLLFVGFYAVLELYFLTQVAKADAHGRTASDSA